MLATLEISRAFEKVIKDQTEGYDLREYLEDTIKYGQTAFTDYWETTELYDRYSVDCNAWLEDLVDERDLNPWDIFPDWEIYPDSSSNKWEVIVFMFEEYCYYVAEGLDF